VDDEVQDPDAEIEVNVVSNTVVQMGEKGVDMAKVKKL